MRLTDAIAATPEGATRMQAAEAKADRYCADEVERGDAPAPGPAQGEDELLAPPPPTAADGHAPLSGQSIDGRHLEELEPHPEHRGPPEIAREVYDAPEPTESGYEPLSVQPQAEPVSGMDIDHVVDEELNYVLSLGEYDQKKEARRRHREIMEVAYALGTCGKSFRRETVSRLRATWHGEPSALPTTACMPEKSVVVVRSSLPLFWLARTLSSAHSQPSTHVRLASAEESRLAR